MRRRLAAWGGGVMALVVAVGLTGHVLLGSRPSAPDLVGHWELTDGIRDGHALSDVSRDTSHSRILVFYPDGRLVLPRHPDQQQHAYQVLTGNRLRLQVGTDVKEPRYDLDGKRLTLFFAQPDLTLIYRRAP